MKKILWSLLKLADNNHGYSTPLQKRFKIGDLCKIRYCISDHKFKIDEVVTIIETGRHDYLVENESGVKSCVYQFELYK